MIIPTTKIVRDRDRKRKIDFLSDDYLVKGLSQAAIELKKNAWLIRSFVHFIVSNG